MENHDVIVVGCGTGGAIASKVCSMAKLDVVAIDTKTKDQIGNKVCGDAITGIYFDMLKDIDLRKPEGNEVTQLISGLKLFGHKKNHCLTIENDENNGYMLNRHIFGQRLVNDTINAGTKLYDNCKVVDTIVKNNQLAGVTILNNKTNERKYIYAKIVIDAGGYAAPIRTRLDLDTPGLEKKIDKRDIEICYREIRNYSLDDPYLKLYVDVDITPGGYIWLFPKGTQVNMGIGVQGNSELKNPKIAYQKFFSSFEYLQDSELVSAGGGVVPVRHPIDSLVSNGLMLVGDSGSQVNPMHGGGIGFSMRAGYYAAKTAINAIKRGKYDFNELWDYNTIYMHDMGAKQASLEVLKLLLQTLTNEQIDFVFRKKLFTSEELMAAVKEGTFKISFFQKIKRLLVSIRHIKLLKKLAKIADLMKKAMKIYEKYPSNASSFDSWKKEQATLFETVYDLCGV